MNEKNNGESDQGFANTSEPLTSQIPEVIYIQFTIDDILPNRSTWFGRRQGW
jgi:hypothetical protein